MSSNTKSTSSSGIGVVGLLGVAFVILKLTHVIAWPWLWVLAPFWIPFGVALVVMIVAVVVLVVKQVRR